MTDQKLKHSPLPWECGQGFTAYCIGAKSRSAIAYTFDTAEADKANAELIVRCVNLHDELVAEITANWFGAKMQYGENSEAFLRLDNLLKRARGEE
jgi:hypothetical protein